MNIEMIGVVLLVVTNIAIVAAAWGDMRRQVTSNKEREDERHRENQVMLQQIREDVQRINGTVARHDVLLMRPKSRTRR